MNHKQNINLKTGRITAKYNKYFRVACETGDVLAVPTGKLFRETGPAAGDMVTVEVTSKQTEDNRLDRLQNSYKKNADLPRGIIHAIEPRKSQFSRKVAGAETKEQVIAANIDFVCIVIGLDDNFKVSRIERYLTAAWESGAEPVIILNKADLVSPEEKAVNVSQTEDVAFGVPVIATSTVTGEGLEDLRGLFRDGKTAVLAGSSGVGKSSIINVLEGRELQEVRETRQKDGKGRHTTTFSRLIPLPGGGSIIDTPGLRELQIWSSEESLDSAFEDIDERARMCKFNDCRHQSEPGCAVREAVERGELSEERLHRYWKLQREIEYLERRKSENWQRLERQKAKEFTKYAKKHINHKRRP